MKIIIEVLDIKRKVTLNCYWWQSFNNIYSKIDKQLNISKEESKTSTRFFRIRIENRDVVPIDTFRVLKFIKLNKLNPNNIISSCYDYGGIGAGGYANDKLKIEIRANEGKHRGKSHIHVSNCKGKHPVSFDLINLSILEGNKYWEKDFTKPEKRKVKDMLTSSKSEFIRFYKEMQLGYVPGPVEYIYDGEKCVLSCKNSTL